MRRRKKSVHPNTRTQPLKVHCKKKKKGPTDTKNMVTCGALQSDYQHSLFSFSSWNKNILPHGAQQHRLARVLMECDSPRLAFCYVCRNHSPRTTQALLDLPLHLGGKSKGTRMGDHGYMEVEVIKHSGWRRHAGQRGAHSQGRPGRPLQRKVELISHFMHTHMPASHI